MLLVSWTHWEMQSLSAVVLMHTSICADSHVACYAHMSGCEACLDCVAVYCGMRTYFQRVKKTYRPLTAYAHESTNGEAGSFSADLDSAEKV